MNIKVLQYIDNTPKNNITTGQVNAPGDSTGADLVWCLMMLKS